MRLTKSAAALALGLAVPSCEQAPSQPGTEGAETSHSALESGDSMLRLRWNDVGRDRTVTPTGTIDTSNPFFQPLGTNGRACVTCHQAYDGWTLTPSSVQSLFDETAGLDPLFAAHDAANAPNLDVSTESARRAAFSLLLDRAVIRVGLPVKATSEFELAAVDDPYGFASATQLSLFRRPLPTANLTSLATINWDGRNNPAADPNDIHLGLKNQSNGATVNHAKATAPIGDDVREAIVAFETSLTHAQAYTWRAEWLHGGGALGGPQNLANAPFSLGINAPPSFDAEVFKLFGVWVGSSDGGRREVAEGERIFNSKTFTVTRADGTSFEATCSGCHNAPSFGSNSTPLRFFDVGVSDPALRSSDVPLYTFRHKVTGETIQTTDPGRALISGLWADMNKFKVPNLRGLAARAPYFHDGSAASLGQVVDHYQRVFNIDFRDGEKTKLVRFLESL